jgi:hypothetical protein
MDLIDKIIDSVKFEECEIIEELDETLNLYRGKKIEEIDLISFDDSLNKYLTLYKKRNDKDKALSKYLQLSNKLAMKKYFSPKKN